MPHIFLTVKSALISSFFLISTSNLCFSQERVYRSFDTQSVLQLTQKQYPEYAENIASIESSITTDLPRGGSNQVYKIPVLFHIVGSDSKSLPDEEQINYQLKALNQAFGSYDPDNRPYTNEAVEKFAPLGANPQIQFYIPEIFEGVKGINIVKTGKENFAISNQIQNPKAGGVDAIDPKKVINIWVGHLDGGNAGYASMPGAPAEVDGIVINPDFFGNEKGTAKAPYNQGKTLVHLMGTYLGLYELWNQTDACADDMVADTPIHGGPTQQVSKEAGSRVITMCQGYILAMYMNYMDNSDDEMLTMFTQGQTDRMRAVLAEDGLRSELVNN
jgi:hypothetical protein